MQVGTIQVSCSGVLQKRGFAAQAQSCPSSREIQLQTLPNRVVAAAVESPIRGLAKIAVAVRSVYLFVLHVYLYIHYYFNFILFHFLLSCRYRWVNLGLFLGFSEGSIDNICIINVSFFLVVSREGA